MSVQVRFLSPRVLVFSHVSYAKVFIYKFIGSLRSKCSRYLFSKTDTATFQNVDIIFAVIHEATNQTVITENDSCHFGNVLVTLIFSYVASVIHQAGNHVTFTNWFFSTFFNLLKKKKSSYFIHLKSRNHIQTKKLILLLLLLEIISQYVALARTLYTAG